MKLDPHELAMRGVEPPTKDARAWPWLLAAGFLLNALILVVVLLLEWVRRRKGG